MGEISLSAALDKFTAIAKKINKYEWQYHAKSLAKFLDEAGVADQVVVEVPPDRSSLLLRYRLKTDLPTGIPTGALRLFSDGRVVDGGISKMQVFKLDRALAISLLWGLGGVDGVAGTHVERGAMLLFACMLGGSPMEKCTDAMIELRDGEFAEAQAIWKMADDFLSAGRRADSDDSDLDKLDGVVARHAWARPGARPATLEGALDLVGAAQRFWDEFRMNAAYASFIRDEGKCDVEVMDEDTYLQTCEFAGNRAYQRFARTKERPDFGFPKGAGAWKY